MTWNLKWRALSARFERLSRAAELLAHTTQGAEGFGLGERVLMQKVLTREMVAIQHALFEFGQVYGPELPPAAREVLEQFPSTLDQLPGEPPSLVVAFLLFQSEFEYLIADHQLESRATAERAFEHLRRTIVVDRDVQAKWASAFATGERRCERLGAVHLLGHGIWAFKIAAAGAETDLVFGDPLHEHVEGVQRAARALVMTEWKVVRSPEELESKAEMARRQLGSYQGGLMADLALTSTRFIVLVTDKALAPPPDIPRENVTYRHIVIATNPEPASVEARRAQLG